MKNKDKWIIGWMVVVSVMATVNRISIIDLQKNMIETYKIMNRICEHLLFFADSIFK